MTPVRQIVVLITFVSLAFCGFTGGYTARVQESSEETTAALDEAELQRMIETAVSRRIRPLQREIADLRENIRFHDILGGIGYIVGIAGIVFYFLGVRRREKTEKAVKGN